MAGELWRSYSQWGVEVTYGTGVAATRRMYFDGPTIDRKRQPRPWEFATGSRDNVRAFTLGPQEITGKGWKQPLSADELIETLLIGIKGAVTPTQPDSVGNPTVYLWTFTPGTTLDSATVELNDGATAYHATGVYGDNITIDGAANKPNNVSLDLFGKSYAPGAMTGSLSQRTPTVIEGWESKLYIDAFGGTAGTTEIDGTLVNWKVEFKNGLAPKYFASNSNALGAVIIDKISVMSTLTFEAAATQTATEFTDWDAATKRLVRLSFGNNEVISTTYKKFVNIDLPGAWSVFDLTKNDAKTRVYELQLQYVYDVTNAFGLQITCQNDRSTAW